MSRNLILGAVSAASVVSFVTIPLSGHISDRIGRKKMYMIGAATRGVFGFLYFGMIDTAVPMMVFVTAQPRAPSPEATQIPAGSLTPGYQR